MKFVLIGLICLVGCTPSQKQFLNPDPVNGGPCGNGNQEAVPCNGKCCPPNTRCVYPGDCEILDPVPTGVRPSDAGPMFDASAK
jgi:hypothetical protein